MLPPPPEKGSPIEGDEIAEIHRIQARATPAEKALAKHDNDVEDPSIFAGVMGPKWVLGTYPRPNSYWIASWTLIAPTSVRPKHYFGRPRPWVIDPTVQTRASHEGAAPLTSYPSGHAMLAFELGVVLAYLIPSKAQAILKRAELYSENRILCGFHFRSDVTAGQQYGSILAVEMLHNPRFLS